MSLVITEGEAGEVVGWESALECTTVVPGAMVVVDGDSVAVESVAGMSVEPCCVVRVTGDSCVMLIVLVGVAVLRE